MIEFVWSKRKSLLTAGQKLFTVACNVRNELNGFRTTENPEDVVYTLPPDGSKPVPYMPRTFPPGRWKITEVKKKDSPYLAPYFIATNAVQMVEEWSLDTDGTYKGPTGKMVPDSGYGLHFSSSSTTLGCGKVMRLKDLEAMVEIIWTAFKNKEDVFIKVEE